MRDPNIQRLRVMKGREAQGEKYYSRDFWEELEKVYQRNERADLLERRLVLTIAALVFFASLAILGWIAGSAL